MKHPLTPALLLTALALPASLWWPSTALAASTGCATVQVENLRPQQGQLMVAAYLSADSYRRQPAVAMALPVGEAVMRFELCGLSGDSVALTLFQDLNGDGKMATNLLGMPTEPWGASGQPGPTGPSWDTTRMPLDQQPLVVRLST